MSKRLTVKAIESLKPTSARREVPDGDVRGMYLAIQPSGAMSFVLRYRHAGRSRKLTIGGVEMGLGEARRRAEAARAAIAGGKDPAGEKTADKAKQADTVEAIVAEFIEKHVERSTKPSTGAEYKRLFEKQIVAAWRGRRLADITRRDVNGLLDEIARHAPIGANRALALLKTFCGWAVSREIIEHAPTDGVQARSIETPRDRALDDRELKIVWSACDAIGWPYRDIVRLLMLTGARRGEVVGMRWCEIDFDKRLWTLPASRTKNKRSHALPLSSAAIGILRSLPRVDGDLVFPSNNHLPVSGYSRAKIRLDRAVAEIVEEEQSTSLAQWGFHDLRRSAASGLARIGVDLPVIERVLNHVSGSFGGIVGVYQKHRFEDRMARALDAWAAHIEVLVSGAPTAKVVAFPKERA
jgi:integrase